MSSVANKVITESFSKRAEQQIHSRKSQQHRKMNEEVVTFFKEHAQAVKAETSQQPRYLFLTITFNQNLLRSLKPENRSAFIQTVYERLWWRMHDKLHIKRPLTTKKHQHLLMRQYQVIEDVDRYGRKALEHLHIVCAVHPKFFDKLTKLYWESVVALRGGFLFEAENRGFDLSECVEEFHISELNLPEKELWSNLEQVIDYSNKGLTRINAFDRVETAEIFAAFDPPDITKTRRREPSYERALSI